MKWVMLATKLNKMSTKNVNQVYSNHLKFNFESIYLRKQANGLLSVKMYCRAVQPSHLVRPLNTMADNLNQSMDSQSDYPMPLVPYLFTGIEKKQKN